MVSISFKYKGEDVKIKSENSVEGLKDICNWLHDNGYKFEGTLHSSGGRQIMSIDDIKNEKIPMSRVYNIKGSGKFIGTTTIGNVGVRLRNIVLMLENFGIDSSTIKTEGFESTPRVKTDDDLNNDLETEEIETEDSEELTPMRSLMLQDFWNKFKSEIDKVSNSYLRVTARGVHYFAAASGIGAVHFTCVVSSRYVRVEIYFNRNREQNKQLFDYFLSKKEEIENSFGDNLEFERMDYAKASRIKYQISSNVYDKNNWENITNFLKTNFIKFETIFQPIFDEIISNPSILNKSNVSQSFTEDETKSEKENTKLPAVRNPFGGESKEAGDEFNSSALFVVGLSGSGKSTRILSLLRENGHKLILIGAENAPSPNLLLDYDHNEGYVPSDIGEFIISSKNDPTHFYTIVFDECHEYIDEIKRSILHAISTKRGEKRFFGVRKSVRGFFEDLETYETTSKIVPDNVGFIFISSKPDVFEYHADFMGRVDKVEVKREDPYPYPDLKYIQSKIDRQDQL